MKVLITGATGMSILSSHVVSNTAHTAGFIGHPAALALSRAGHIVYGQTRSETSGTLLAKDEIVPLIFDPTTEEGLDKFVETAKDVDVGRSPFPSPLSKRLVF